MKRNFTYSLFALFLLFASCAKEDEKLPGYEERVDAALSSLENELIIPENGWKLKYKPTPESGEYFVLLKFDENGDVNIKTDLSSNSGEFYDQTIPYRVDNGLDLELILETYGFFHFLFEQDQASFGAEFEFIYKEKSGANLVFESKSDPGVKTQLIFEPAAANDMDNLARTLSENLEKFRGYGPKILNYFAPIQQLYLTNQNISVFWAMDPLKRNIAVDLAGVGNSIEEIIANDMFIGIFHNTGFSLSGNKIILNIPLEFDLNGQTITISEIQLTDFSMTGPGFCTIDPVNTPRYDGQIQGTGPISLFSSLYSSSGLGFQSDNIFTVNVFYVFDSAGNSLSEEGIIAEKYPDASGFAFLYGAELSNQDIPKYSTGILGNVDIYLRGFDSTETVGNKVNVVLNDQFYFSDSLANLQDTLDLIETTDEIFYGNEIYAFEYPIEGLTVYWIYNPCNEYEFLGLP